MKFKLIQAFSVVLITCKNEEDPIKNGSAKVVTTSKIDFQTLKTANSVIGGEVGPKFKLIQALIVVLVTCKNEKDPF